MEIQIKIFTPEQAVHTEIENIYYTGIKDLLYIERPVYADKRGYFREIGNVPDIERIIGLPFDIK